MLEESRHRVVAVLLADGWHEVTCFEYQVWNGPPETPYGDISEPGFYFDPEDGTEEDSDNYEYVTGPLTAVLALRTRVTDPLAVGNGVHPKMRAPGVGDG